MVSIPPGTSCSSIASSAISNGTPLASTFVSKGSLAFQPGQSSKFLPGIRTNGTELIFTCTPGHEKGRQQQKEDRLKHLVFPKHNTAVRTSSNQQIMLLTDIRPVNPRRMPVQSQVANPTFGVPYSYSMIPITGDNPLTVAREERNRTNGFLWSQSECG